MPIVASVVAAIGLVFFGLCTFLWIKWLFDIQSEIIIDARGIQYRRWSDQPILWADIAELFEFSIQKQRMIGLNLHDPAEYPGGGLMGNLASAKKLYRAQLSQFL